MMMRHVAVLMCTYNGSRYVEEQIDSILDQKNVEVSLFVRDDGSTDGTQQILDSYKGRGQLNWYQGENIGPASGFMELLYKYGQDGFDYYAFADQDDIWFEDKLERAVRALKGVESKYSLYGANQTLYKEGYAVGNVYDEMPCMKLPFLLNHNKIAGCTIVFNRELAELVVSSKNIDDIILNTRMHDLWLVLIASACGEVVFDLAPCMYYRIHEANVVGQADERLLARLNKSALCDRTRRNSRSLYAKELLRCFGNHMHHTCKDILELYALYRDSLAFKMRFLRAKNTIRMSGENTLVFRCKILMGYI